MSQIAALSEVLPASGVRLLERHETNGRTAPAMNQDSSYTPNIAQSTRDKLQANT
jgi:hypothetical protein